MESVHQEHSVRRDQLFLCHVKMEVTTVSHSKKNALFAPRVITARQSLWIFYHTLAQLDTTVLMEQDLHLNFHVLVVLTVTTLKEQVWNHVWSVRVVCIVKDVVSLNQQVIVVLDGTVLKELFNQHLGIFPIYQVIALKMSLVEFVVEVLTVHKVHQYPLFVQLASSVHLQCLASQLVTVKKECGVNQALFLQDQIHHALLVTIVLQAHLHPYHV